MIALLTLVACTSDHEVAYHGHRVVRVAVPEQRDLDTVLALVDDVWSHGVTDHVDVRVSRHGLRALERSGLRFEVLIPDVQQAIDRVRPQASAAGGFFDDWRDLEAFDEHLFDLEAASAHATVVEVGASIDGRPIHGLVLEAAPGLPGMAVTGAMHAREWVAAASAMWAADRLALEYGTDPDVTALLDTYQVLVVPVVNPDGYRHSWTTDRLWRKNRRDNLDGTFGVDLNRNWDAAWSGVGSSGDTASQNYRGTAPFSEPETRALADWLHARPAYGRHLDLHCTGQVVLYPWAFSPEPSFEAPTLEAAGAAMRAAMVAVHGTSYDDGQLHTRLYPASGVGVDWTHGRQGMHSFLFELRDRGHYGFLLPADQLAPTAEEAWAGLLELAAVGAPPRPRLDAPDPVAGDVLTVDLWRLTPGTPAEVWVSTVGLGSTAPPLELEVPELVGTAMADPGGHARIVGPLPFGAATGDLLTLQGMSGGVVSTLLPVEVR